MGLFEELRRLNTTEMGTQLIGPTGKPFALFPVDAAVSATATHEILRGDLAMMLTSVTRNDSNVTYRLGTTVKSVLENSDQTVRVELSDAT